MPISELPGLQDFYVSDQVLILGAGLAGLFLALQLAPRKCLVICPGTLGSGSSSAWAQGGLAAALAPEDSPEQHALDTMQAGAGLVDPDIALMVAKNGPDRIRDLLALGVPFDRSENGQLSLALEAAHRLPRIAKVKGDLAGKEIMAALIRAANAQPSIEIFEHHKASQLLVNDQGNCIGAPLTGSKKILAVIASQTILATGGCGGLFQLTTNPTQAVGDGFAMAARIGAQLADLEFMQFHPTAMDVGKDPAPLATEALRGAGAYLINNIGKRFCFDHDPRGELASRDVVARAIAIEQQAGRKPMLDTRSAIGNRIERDYPTVFEAALGAGFDLRKQPILIAPAAHYHCGGIATDSHGASSVPGLWAIGETACTGLHGANRLASNSLLEAVVFAHRCARKINEAEVRPPKPPSIKPPKNVKAPSIPEKMRCAASNFLGVYRSSSGLKKLLLELKQYEANLIDRAETPELPLWHTSLRFMSKAALRRKENIGGHYLQDAAPAAKQPYRQFVQPKSSEHANEIWKKVTVPRKISQLTEKPG